MVDVRFFKLYSIFCELFRDCMLVKSFNQKYKLKNYRDKNLIINLEVMKYYNIYNKEV